MASSATTRRVIVDDTNSAIMYNGNWVVDSQGTQDGVGNSGPAFQHTLHRAPGSFGSLTFTFDGSSVDVVGKLTTGNNADGTEPTWVCLVDGQTIASAAVERDQNNQVLCSVEGLQEGVYHYLTLESSSDHVWVDYFEYTPTSFNTWNPFRTPGSFVSIPNQDSTFSYDSSWSRSDSGIATTSSLGATFNTTFLGNSLMWYGMVPSGSFGAVIGTYSIDGQPPVTFVVNHTTPNDPTVAELTNQVFFETPLLTYEGHSLAVTFTGQGGGLPFTLDRLVVRDQMETSFATSSAYYSFVTATAWPTASAGWPASEGAIYNSRPMSGGAIAATVIGSVLGFALIVAALLFFWRRRRRAAAQMPAQGFVPPHPGDEKAVGKADTSSIFSRIREKITKEKEELDYAKPPAETEQLPAYKARNSGMQNEAVDRVW